MKKPHSAFHQRQALMAMVTEEERKQWQAFARRYEQRDLTVNPSPAAKRALDYLERCRREILISPVAGD
jgi:hypothetical protein